MVTATWLARGATAYMPIDKTKKKRKEKNAVLLRIDVDRIRPVHLTAGPSTWDAIDFGAGSRCGKLGLKLVLPHPERLSERKIPYR